MASFIGFDKAGLYLLADQQGQLTNLIERKKYRVTDTPLTYRQIYLLSRDGLLDDMRKESKGWREFSFKELVYLTIIKEFRHFGVLNNQLLKLKESFFNKPSDPVAAGMNESKLAIAITLLEEQVILTLKAPDEVCCYDLEHFSEDAKFLKSFIYLNLNSVVNEVLEKIGKKAVEYYSFSEAILQKDSGLTEAEAKLITVIRKNDYYSITITKKDGEKITARAQKTSVTANPQEIINLIRRKDYGSISLKMQNGSIVNINSEDVYKLN